MIFNENWQNIGSKPFTTGTTNTRNIGSEVLITANPNLPALTTLYKTDKSLNIVKNNFEIIPYSEIGANKMLISAYGSKQRNNFL